MSEISRWNVMAVVGETDELIIREALGTKCSFAELQQARALVDGAGRNGAPAEELAARMQRLVDLLSVARPPSLSSAQADNAAAEGRRHAA